jgi:hypothetical protein
VGCFSAGGAGWRCLPSPNTVGDVLSLPELPFGWKYAAIGLLVAGLLGAVLQQLLADWLHRLTVRAGRWLASRVRWFRRDPWRGYAAAVMVAHDKVALGFLRGVSVTLDDVYVPLQYESGGRRFDVYRDIQNRPRVVVLGGAGAGKSMLLRHSTVRWAQDPPRSARIPVLVELARSNRDQRGIESLIADALARSDVDDGARVTAEALRAGQLCVFLDGLDEITTERRPDVAADIADFAARHPDCQIVVTSRDALYDNDLGPAFDHEIRIAGFDDAGIRHFLRLWFTRARSDDTVLDEPPDPRAKVEELMAELRASPNLMRLARSPLLLTMITALNEADPGAGPMLTNSRAEFYDLAVTHLLRRDRDLGRHTQLARYRPGHKLIALRAIALAAQGATAAGTESRELTEQEVYAETGRLMSRFGLDAGDVPRMTDEIVDRSGLLLRIDDTKLLYEFAHLTLQEYLAAVELADQPDRLLELYRKNPPRWRETVKLWCGGAANRDATDLVRQLYAGDGMDQLLALECIAEARQLDEQLAEEIVTHFEAELPRTAGPLVCAALGAVAARHSPLGNSVLQRSQESAGAGGLQGTGSLNVLAESRRREAIETLSELAPDDLDARAALRSVGELAIPVLAARSRAGSLSAADDLAAIGTPDAAVALAQALWTDDPAARRAAWRLAELIRAPAVEAELDRLELPDRMWEGADSIPVWLPFFEPRENFGTYLAMNRAAWLISQSEQDEIPGDLRRLDARLVLGLEAHREAGHHVPPLTRYLPDALQNDLAISHRELSADRRAWLDVNKEPTGRWRYEATAWTAAVFVLDSSVVAWSPDILFGPWIWTMIASLLCVPAATQLLRRGLSETARLVRFLAICPALAAVGAGVGGWTGWIVAIALIVAGYGVVLTAFLFEQRYHAAVENPYRRLLALDDRGVLDHSTLIAPAESKPLTQRRQEPVVQREIRGEPGD